METGPRGARICRRKSGSSAWQDLPARQPGLSPVPPDDVGARAAKFKWLDSRFREQIIKSGEFFTHARRRSARFLRGVDAAPAGVVDDGDAACGEERAQ